MVVIAPALIVICIKTYRCLAKMGLVLERGALSGDFGARKGSPLYVAEKLTNHYGGVLGNRSILKGPQKPRNHNKSSPLEPTGLSRLGFPHIIGSVFAVDRFRFLGYTSERRTDLRIQYHISLLVSGSTPQRFSFAGGHQEWGIPVRIHVCRQISRSNPYYAVACRTFGPVGDVS